MATINEGIFGIPNGKIGPLTFYTRNGRKIVRPAHNSGKVKATPARLIQRAKLKICSDFARAFTGTGFFNMTFPAYGHGGTGHNRAMSSLLNLAVRGNYPDQVLAYERVLISRGPLPYAERAECTADGAGRLVFSWSDNSADGTARPADKVILVAYAPALKQALFSTNGGSRSDGSATLRAGQFLSQSAATWIAFINENGDVSDSVFTGMVAV